MAASFVMDERSHCDNAKTFSCRQRSGALADVEDFLILKAGCKPLREFNDKRKSET